MCKVNEGKTDRIIRIFLGLVLLFLGGFVFKNNVRYIALAFGLVLFFTGISGYCLLYDIFKIKTNK